MLLRALALSQVQAAGPGTAGQGHGLPRAVEDDAHTTGNIVLGIFEITDKSRVGYLDHFPCLAHISRRAGTSS